MPVYEFHCIDCGAATDVRASIEEKSAGLRPVCAACGSTVVRQAFRAVAVTGTASQTSLPPAPSGGGCCGGGCCGG